MLAQWPARGYSPERAICCVPYGSMPLQTSAPYFTTTFTVTTLVWAAL